MNHQDLSNHIIIFDILKASFGSTESEIKKRETKNFLFLVKSLVNPDINEDALSVVLNTMVNMGFLKDGEKSYMFRPDAFSFDMNFANRLVDSKGKIFVPRAYTDHEILNMDMLNDNYNHADMFGQPMYQPIMIDMLSLVLELFATSKKPKEHIGMRIITNTLIEHRILISVFDPAHKTTKNFKELFEK